MQREMEASYAAALTKYKESVALHFMQMAVLPAEGRGHVPMPESRSWSMHGRN
jgi:hypothetical protein